MKIRTRPAGFSLVELLVTIAIGAILMGFGIPAYRQYTMRANRVDATTALLKIAANQERFYLQNNTYAAEAQRGVAPPNGLGIPNSDNGYYTLAIQLPAGGQLTQGFTALAIPAAGGRQVADTACALFTINEQGQRAAFNQGGADNTATCWR